MVDESVNKKVKKMMMMMMVTVMNVVDVRLRHNIRVQKRDRGKNYYLHTACRGGQGQLQTLFLFFFSQ